jgi:hypothetical protein
VSFTPVPLVVWPPAVDPVGSLISVSVVPLVVPVPLVPVVPMPVVPVPVVPTPPAPPVVSVSVPVVPVPMVRVPVVPVPVVSEAPVPVVLVPLAGMSRPVPVSSRRHPKAAVAISAANKAERVNDMSLLLAEGESQHPCTVNSLIRC